MPFDFSKMKAKKKENQVVNPIELFQKLKIVDPTINDLWLAQGDALREWHSNRMKPDIGIVLNTGAGKTLVGLLIALSLVNERRGGVLYVCSSIQLIDQTAEKAKGYGLDVTTYFRGSYSNDLYRLGEAPCLTSYQAVFNGRSVFFREGIAGVIFDDAHAAEHLIRDQFSLRISREDTPTMFADLVSLFRSYHQDIGMVGSYQELENKACQRLFLVPPFEVQRQLAELLRILTASGISGKETAGFAWEYLKDRIDLCCVLLTGSEVTITPPFIPVRTLPFFQESVRRVYLSATLSASDAFARTFGKTLDHIVAPTTTAGECERLVLVPLKSDPDQDDVDIAKTLVANHKTLIIVPTYARATKWQGVAEPPPRKEVSGHVKSFREGKDAIKLLLAGRYDGIDLPGDTCRVMVIDDLPLGMGPLERFLWEYLGLFTALTTTISSRVVQSFGRISRGMSDYGVVIITGNKLVEWLLTPRNRAVLPAFLQKQIALGMMVSSQAQTREGLVSAMAMSLGRDKTWLSTYNEFMAAQEVEKPTIDRGLLAELATAEAEYACHIWHRDYVKAAKSLQVTLEKAFDVSEGTGAWHTLWIGRARELLGDRLGAEEMYGRAHACKYNIPSYPTVSQESKSEDIPAQVREVVRQFIVEGSGSIAVPRRLIQDMRYLDGSGTPNQVEESLRALGQYLGMKSSRPEKEYGTGPDVMWELADLPTLCIEAKTDKGSDSKYQKKDMGQMSDHIQWVKDNTSTKEIIPVFVGPVVGATESANPPGDFRVGGLDEFKSLAERLEAALRDISTSAMPLTLLSETSRVFRERKLLWPDAYSVMKTSRIRDL